jgi:thiamine kinase-like enzyme
VTIDDQIREAYFLSLDLPLDERRHFLKSIDETIAKAVRALLNESETERQELKITSGLLSYTKILGQETQLPEEMLEYKLLEKVHSSHQTQIYKAIHKRLNRIVLLKASKLKSREAEFLAQIQSQNVLHVYDEFTWKFRDENYFILVTEFLDGANTITDYFGLVAQNNGENFARLFMEAFHTLFLNLAELHRVGVIHCDIKPKNVLITSQGVLKIIDFNVAQHLETPDEGFFGATRHYAHPDHWMMMQEGRIDLGFWSNAPIYDLYGAAVVGLEVLQDHADVVATGLREKLNLFFNELMKVKSKKDAATAAEIKIYDFLQSYHMTNAAKKLIPTLKTIEASRMSAFAPYMCTLFPNLLAALFQILYNNHYIVRFLSVEQKEVFYGLVPWINGTLFLVNAVIISWAYGKVPGQLFSKETIGRHRLEQRSHVEDLVWIYRLSSGLNVFSWGASGLVFSTCLKITDVVTQIHFLLSFLFACLIGLYYQRILIYILNFFYLWPQFPSNVRAEVARLQAVKSPPRSGTMLIPALIASIVLVVETADTQRLSTSSCILILFMLVLSSAGHLVSFKLPGSVCDSLKLK